MLDFQRGPRPRNYLSRREQWRLLLLVGTLGLVVILMIEARKPEHYRWLFGAGDAGTESSGADRAVSEDRKASRSDKGGQAAHGTLLPKAPKPPVADKPSVADKPLVAREDNDEIPGTSVSSVPVEVGGGRVGARGSRASTDRTTPTEANPSSRYFPGVKPAYVQSAREDRLLGVSEWDALLHFLDILEKNDEATLQRASGGRVSFVQLFEQSAEYRGELVTTSGIIRRAHPTETPQNDYGLRRYYRTWLWPADHPTDPMMVWCLHLPDGFPMGMEIAERAEVTGFYYRLVAYQAADGRIRKAPMLLARTVHWHKRAAAVQTPHQSPGSLLLLFAGSAALAVLATALVYYRTRGKRVGRREREVGSGGW